MYHSFILHTICHFLKRTGKNDEHINKINNLPQSVQLALQQLQKVAFDGLKENKTVFTIDELPEMCRDDPTCYGLLQSVEYITVHMKLVLQPNLLTFYIGAYKNILLPTMWQPYQKMRCIYYCRIFSCF